VGRLGNVESAFRKVVRPSRCLTAALVVALLAGAVSSAATAAGARTTRTHPTRTGSSRVAEDVRAHSADEPKESSSKLLTVVARVCPTYQDVMANLARNDIQESLQDLGKNTVYSSGQTIDPSIEAREQPNCTPLPDWTFTLGTGYQSRAVSGTWGSLSIVTGSFSTSLVTKETTDLLNDQGQKTDDQIEGAATIELTPAQADLAAHPDSLWIQGGTTTDPILDKTYPGQYGFAALRCAIDNLNGDNVEWIGYPAGASHVFCYAYYVKPPPTSGTIIITKAVSSPAGATHTFSFGGNVSFNANGTFQLAVQNGAPASTTFYRAETGQNNQPWSVQEMVPPGWSLSSLTCSSHTGKSTTTTSLETATATITLAPADTVTCTYTDSETPPLSALTLTKTTIGGVGRFDYIVTPAGGGASKSATATTSKPGVEVAATPEKIELPAGQYKIAESLPSANGGAWMLTAVACDGKKLPAVSPVTVTLAAGTGSECAFENTFVPTGAITIRKKAFGKTGTIGFTISPETTPPSDLTYSKTAKVTQEGVAVVATGDATSDLPLGTYKIQELAVGGADPTGWALTSVVCNGELVGSSQGAVLVTLTAQTPTADCTFTDTFTPPTTPKPPTTNPPTTNPPPTSPEPPPGSPTPTPSPEPIPTTTIDLTKKADRSTVAVGGTVTYTIKATNTGDAPAQGVHVAEQAPLTNSKILSLSPSQGSCDFTHTPASCNLGTINPGKTVTIVAALQATHPGPMPNNVAVHTGTQVLKPPTAEAVADAVVTKPAPKPKPPKKPSPKPKPTKPKPTPPKPTQPKPTPPKPTPPKPTPPPFTG
jgi:uncharacterized repeat protein (TIGR01451 family)